MYFVAIKMGRRQGASRGDRFGANGRLGDLTLPLVLLGKMGKYNLSAGTGCGTFPAFPKMGF
jgi:hypothetical protein